MLDLVLAPVPRLDQAGDQGGGVDGLAPSDHDRLDVLHVGPEALHEGLHRRHWGAGRRSGWRRRPCPQPAAHGLDAGADLLERQGLPRREEVDRALAEVGDQVAGEALRIAEVGTATTSGRRWLISARPATVKARAASGHGRDRRRAPEQLEDRGLVPQQLGQ